MGAWSYEALANDNALDLMGYLVDNNDIKTDIYRVLHGEYYDMDEMLLAVEIVDASINGVDEAILGSFYGYEEWFKELKKTPLTDLIDDAICVVKFIQEKETEQNYWVADVRADRKELLASIETRLKQGKAKLQETECERDR